MRCGSVRRRLALLVDDELALEDRLRVEAHAEACAACARELARLRRLEQAIAALPEPPPRTNRGEVEQALVAVRARLVAGAATRPGAPAEPARPPRARWIAATVLLAAGVLLAWALGAEDEEPAPDLLQPPVSVAADARDPAPLARTAREVETALRRHLVAAFGQAAEEGDVARAAHAFDELAGDLRAWPLVRIAETLLGDPDVVLATAAARYLGVRGDRISISALRAVLDRPEAAPAAVRALGDLGPHAVSALDRALDDPALVTLALETLERVGGDDAARSVERSLAARLASSAPRAPLDPLASRHLAALGAMGAPALESFLRLASREAFSSRAARAELFLHLGALQGGREAFGADLRGLRSRHDLALLLEVAALLESEAALPWVAELACESRHRPLALDSLTRWSGAAPVAVILDLDAAGCVPDDALLATFRVLLDADDARADEEARTLIARADSLRLARYLELLVASEHPGAAGALVTIAREDRLSDGERQWAALAVGLLGGEREARALLDGALAPELEDARLLAGMLVSIHRHLREDGVREALAGIPERSVQRVLEVLADAASRGADETVTLFRVARLVDGPLQHRNPTVASSNP